MKTSWTLRIDGEPIKLSDGSILIPFVEELDVRQTAATGDKFLEQLYNGIPDAIHPLCEVVIRKLEETRDAQIQAAEQLISKAKAEKAELAAKQKAEQEAAAKAEAEAKTKNDEQSKQATPPATPAA